MVLDYQKPHELEKTVIYKSGTVQHYTCNPPSQSILNKHGIHAIGDTFNCRDSREMLLIPSKVYAQFGFEVRKKDITQTSEYLLRKLGK